MRSDELDRLLDQALSDYSNAEPRHGLESRVMAGVRERQPAHSWWRWAVPALACGLLLIAAVVWMRQEPVRRVEVALTPAVSPAPPAALVERPIVPIARRVPVRKTAPQPVPMPKLEQFPSPAPMTDEERALLTFVRNNPEMARQVLADVQKPETKLIQIDEIHIEPLRNGG